MLHHLCERCKNRRLVPQCQRHCEAYQNSMNRMKREREQKPKWMKPEIQTYRRVDGDVEHEISDTDYIRLLIHGDVIKKLAVE